MAIQALVVYTGKMQRVFCLWLNLTCELIGYLIPPSKMHPWLKWLKWINPVQYAFEGLMANEFNSLKIVCEPPFVVPSGPGAIAAHQGCTIQGSSPDSLIVRGAQYIGTAFGYSRGHLWRNFGIIAAWLAFFVIFTMVGMEFLKPNKGGSSVTIFKHGEVPKTVEDSSEKSHPPADVESGVQNLPSPGLKEANPPGQAHGIVKSTSTFTFDEINYSIPTETGPRQLLENVTGFVTPGRLEALMGPSGAGYIILSILTLNFFLDTDLFQKNNPSQLAGTANHVRGGHR